MTRALPLLLILLLTFVELGLCLFAQRTVRSVTNEGVRVAQEIHSRLVH